MQMLCITYGRGICQSVRVAVIPLYSVFNYK